MSRFEKSGKIDSVFLPELFLEISTQGKTGFLALENSSSSLYIYFDKGTPFYAEGDNAHPSLRQVLLDNGKITKQQYEELESIFSDEEKKNTEELVVKKGILTPHELSDILQTLIYEKIINALTFTEGTYSFEESAALPENTFRCDLNPYDIIYELIRRYTDISGIDPKGVEVTRKEDFTERISKLNLGPGELRISQLLNKNYRIADIIESENFDNEKVIHLLIFLSVCGLVETKNLSVVDICSASFKNKQNKPGNYAENTPGDDPEIIDLEEEIYTGSDSLAESGGTVNNSGQTLNEKVDSDINSKYEKTEDAGSHGVDIDVSAESEANIFKNTAGADPVNSSQNRHTATGKNDSITNSDGDSETGVTADYTSESAIDINTHGDDSSGQITRNDPEPAEWEIADTGIELDTETVKDMQDHTEEPLKQKDPEYESGSGIEISINSTDSSENITRNDPETAEWETSGTVIELDADTDIAEHKKMQSSSIEIDPDYKTDTGIEIKTDSNSYGEDTSLNYPDPLDREIPDIGIEPDTGGDTVPGSGYNEPSDQCDLAYGSETGLSSAGRSKEAEQDNSNEQDTEQHLNAGTVIGPDTNENPGEASRDMNHESDNVYNIDDILPSGTTENIINDEPEKQDKRDERDNSHINEITEFFDFVSGEEDSFKILGISRDTNDSGVKEAYFKLVKKFHPDANPHFPREIRNKAEAIFTKVTQAYESVSTRDKRESYSYTKEADQIKDKARVIYEAEVLFGEGEQNLRQRRYEEAADKFSKAFELNPEEAAYLGALAWATFLSYSNKESIINDSIKQLEKAVSMNKNIADNFYYLGALHKFSENSSEAEKNFARAVEIDPEHIQAKRELRLLKNRKQGNKQNKSKKSKGGFWSSLFKKK